MIRLVYSNRTEELARTLARDLEAARHEPGASVFDPLTLVVPNKNVEIFVKLALAKAHGIAANLDVHLLRRFLGTAAARGSKGARLVEPETVTGLLLDRLLDRDSLARPELDAVRHYLTSAGNAADAVDLRRIGLATHVARLFEEYGYSRPDMLRAWETGPVLGDTAFASAETWQRRLWLDLFDPNPATGLVAAKAAAVGERWLSLADLFAEVSPAALQVPPRVHLFGISYVSRAFHTLFARLAEACELHIYTLNPCMEFWEDVGDATPRRDAARFPKRASSRVDGASMLYGDDDPFHLDSPRDPPALRLWGRPGRENVRLLNELASCDFEAAFVDPLAGASAPTLLRALQHDILVRDEEALRDGVAGADASLRILACPSIRREAEAVASAIWSLVRENAHDDAPRLRFNEIAVVVPSSEYDAYHTHIGAAFAESHALPHYVLDVPLARTSRVAEALDLLLALPFGTFTRKEVMRVVAHPAVMARFPDVAREDWALLPARLGVVHGKDHADHAGTYIERDILNWDQGIRRLALGAFMAGESSGDARPYVLPSPDGEHAYLPEEAQGSSREAVAAFGALVSSLLEDARYAKSAELTMAEWAVFLRALASSYVAASNDAEERALFECLDALGGLTDFDLGDRKVSYRIASELARARLTGLTSARDGYLAGGVAVASFLPMRAIPFKAIFVMGLGEGKFPQGDPRDPLDLRLETRRPGDVRPREQDKYMFLETVLCARDRLYLSYVDRDALTGEALSPSSVVSDVLGMLEGHLGKEATASLATRYPLRRYGEADFPSIYDASAAPGTRSGDRFGAPLAARHEAQAAALRRDLEAHLGAAPPDLATLRRALAPDLRRAIDARLGVAELPDPSEPTARDLAGPAQGATTLSLSVTALRKFLECPLQGYARYRLGLDEEDEGDPLDAEDELLETPALARTMFLRQVFLEAQERGAALDAVYDEKRARLELAGGAPVGLFAEAERASQLALLDEWSRLVSENAPATAPRAMTPARFGRADEHVAATSLHDAVVLDLVPSSDGPVRVEIHGATQPLTETPSTSWTFVPRAAPTGAPLAGKVKKRALAAFLDHVLLAASEAGHDGAPHTANLCFATADDGTCIPMVFPPLSRDEARAYLTDLASDLLSGHHAYLLPCEAVFAYLDDASPAGAAPLQEKVDELVDKYESDPDRNRFSSVEGPLAHAERYPPPDEAAARAMVDRRFALFAKGRIALPEKQGKEPA